MNKIGKYKVLEYFNNVQIIINEVNDAIRQGYIPLGGISVCTTQQGSAHYCQAIYKPNPDSYSSQSLTLPPSYGESLPSSSLRSHSLTSSSNMGGGKYRKKTKKNTNKK